MNDSNDKIEVQEEDIKPVNKEMIDVAPYMGGVADVSNVGNSAEYMLDKIRGDVKTNSSDRGLDRKTRIENKRENALKLVGTFQDQLDADVKYAKILIEGALDVRKKKFLDAWLAFLMNDGAATRKRLDEFVLQWMEYIESAEDKANASQIDDRKKQILLKRIEKNQFDMLEEIDSLVDLFKRKNGEYQDKASKASLV